MPHDMIDEYFNIYKECIEEYGENVCVFYACGSFYEVYSISNENEKLGNGEKISEIIRCEFSNKNKSKKNELGYSTRDNPDFCGFGIPYLSKYLNPLLENNYTVIIVDQLESSQNSKGKLVKRGITAVHSPCLKSPDYENLFDTEYNLLSVFIEIIPLNYKLSGILSTHHTLIYSVCSINNTTNEIEISENFTRFKNNEFQLGLDEISRVLLRYNIGEMRGFFKCDDQNNSDWYKSIIKYLDDLSNYSNFNYKCDIVTKDSDKYKEYIDITFQNTYLKKIYQNINFSMLTPIEYLALSDKELSILNFMFVLDFMAKHDHKYITNLSLPKIIRDSENLVLELNTLTQLSILPNNLNTNSKISSVFDVINFTKTAIGKRHLKNILSKPFKTPEIIEQRYNLTEELDNYSLLNDTSKFLTNLIDFERLHRKMGLQALHPYEFEKLNLNYIKIIELFNLILNHKDLYYLKQIVPEDQILNNFKEYITDYRSCFDLEQMRTISLYTNKDEIVNFFKKDVVKELDVIQNNIKDLENSIELLKREYEDIINQPIKVGFTDNDGYFFTCTKIRYQKLINELEKRNVSTKNFNMRATSNTVKFYTTEFTKHSNNLINTRELLVKKVKINYLLKLSEYTAKYNNVFSNLTKFIEIIDVVQSNLICAKRYKYCKPHLYKNKSPSVQAIAMRHPIIEIIIDDTEYISNDINLEDDNLGILLYGLNSSGKSSLLRALGINLILAQCGLYVPCKSFIFSPFSTLISQVDLTDNLFANKSSFISEMCGLKKILNCCKESTLVLSDELCRGTEVNSSTAIVASTILELIKTNTKFFFTTHLHLLPNIKSIQNQSKLNICHLSVGIENDKIIFERYLKPGSGSTLYGLEVCSSIIQNSNFIDTSFEIRNEILNNNTNILNNKRSNYNKKKITNHCETCGYIPTKNSLPLDTHHIQEQKNCDENGFVKDKSYHKNKCFNLVSLCKSCHLKIDTGELVIHGYKQTTNGIILDYYFFEK
jgi:DNA mismatch repair protein MutS|uniref:DNA mismatch repair proteins mutS family domain-containing protein n=1 Tax=viral metagenome TaxID=1070528 RepID=A0A6C0ALH5_9ZZZZ